ncbi:LppU/SCO3897 family protein [Amycolatopsis alkalitolerans]|uniref:Uncharacterized protein n=1 Tax=Amycolatopsis alkalitolerans TaxID=2547244 RepID=A0A5C4M907_9PSEU|nr:hypothetical protein [Amycolatopsis alkalitolerans]TNC29596.1 hypothetical protein FG385_01115 [Amycolatopsis alkalitolerans]
MSVPPSPGRDGQPNPFVAPGTPPPYGRPGGYPPPGGPGQVPGYGPMPGGPGQLPGGFPPPGSFNPPPQKKSKLRWLRFAIPGIVLVLVVGGLAARFIGTPTDRAAVGDCLNIKEFKDGAEPAKVDCNDPSANVKIGVRLDDENAKCPDGDYDEYWVSGDRSYKLCLMLNAHEGDCFANVRSDTEGYKRVDCADPSAEVKILKVVDGTASDSACEGTGAHGAVKYSQPPTTLCATSSTNNA